MQGRSMLGLGQVKGPSLTEAIPLISLTPIVFTQEPIVHIKKGCFVPLSHANCQNNLNQILHRPPHQLRKGSFYNNDPV